MLEIDFSEGFYTNNQRQMGKCGITDRHRKYHTLVYGIFKSENSHDASRLLSISAELLKIYTHCNPQSVLCDGALALSAAQRITDGINFILDCFAHISRPLSARGTGQNGSRGSIDISCHKD